MSGNTNSNNETRVLKFTFGRARRFLPYIILVALGIGTVNFFLNGDLFWIQWIVLAFSTSAIIGFTTVLFFTNKKWLVESIHTPWKRYLLLVFTLIFVGLFATEFEQVLRSFVFKISPYLPWNARKIYLVNSIISLFLGISLFELDSLFANKNDESAGKVIEASVQDISNEKKKLENTIPVKDGENIRLIPITDIVYFEAFDNYSFIYDLQGQRKLCDYSLLFLEKRLDEKFARIHRRYIVHKVHIHRIKPYLNGRFLIEFNNPKIPPIHSSKSYSKAIKQIIKID